MPRNQIIILINLPIQRIPAILLRQTPTPINPRITNTRILIKIQRKKALRPKKSSRYNEFLERAAAIERYDNSLDYDYMPQVEINTSTYEVFKRWDDLLNEVYQYLKSTMSSSEFEKLKQDEQKWVAEKENAVDEAAAEWLGGSGEAMIRNGTAIQYTKDRCYYLISLTK